MEIKMKRLIKKISRRYANEAGFTLMEAMVGVAVFSIGILGMAALQTTTINSNTLAEDVQLSTVTAMDQIEELMATDFLDQRINTNGTTCGPAPNDPKYNICVQRLDDQGIPGAKYIIVTSTFTPPAGRAQVTTLKIFKPDIDNVSP